MSTTGDDAVAQPLGKVTARSKRRPFRREQILASAVRLFHERGYHATGIDDIGKATGLTGSAIYRHYQSKEAILTDAVIRGSDQILAKVQDIVRTSSSPAEVIERLARNFARATLNQPAIAAVVSSERRLLAAEIRAHIDRAMRLHMEEWMHAFTRLRPDLPDSEARVMVHAAWGMLETPCRYHSGMDPDVLENMLVDMVLKILIPQTSTTLPS
jgi:AcrR family transcriptional regulator